MKRIAIFVLLICLMLTACNDVGIQTMEISESAEIYTIKILYGRRTDSIKDIDLIIERVNEYIKPKIDAQIELIFSHETSLANTVSDYILSGEQLDLFNAGSSAARFLKQHENLLPMDNLLDEYGQGIKANMDQKFIDFGKVGNRIYALPTQRDFPDSGGFEYNKEISNELGLDMNIKSLEQLTEIFEKVKSAGYGGTTQAFIGSWDGLSDGLGVIMNFGQSNKVENLYETAEYEKLIKLMRMWYEKGYFIDDTMADYKSLLSEKKIFGISCHYKPGFEGQETAMIGVPIGCYKITRELLTTDSTRRFMWMIPKTCKNPQKTMQFLNLLYSDEAVVNLLHYGIEGIHYEYKDKENNIVGYPSGKDFTNVGYNKLSGVRWGNQLISHVWETDPPNIWQQLDSFNKNALESYANGFMYDAEPVKNEVLQCQKIVDQYADGLQTGKLDPDVYLPKFRSELKAAGIDKVVAEKQRQLDNWRKEKQPNE